VKTPKLLKLSKEALNDEKSKIYRKKSCLKELQLKLKKKNKKLKEKTQHEKDGKEQKKLENEIKIVSAQRHKIIKVLKSLK
jgi:hypothetical protein